jgi:hypothetical protein
MLRNLIATSLAAALAASTGCYSDSDVSAGPAYGYSNPDLEYVSPGVQVVDDSDYPVFFSDGFYWRYDGGIWYQSQYWNRGWSGVGYGYVPLGIRGIRSPYAYSHWHGGYAHVGVVGRTYGHGYGRGYGRVTGRTYARGGQAHVVARSSSGHAAGSHGGGHHR